jgi:exopolysaccharide production protein ExoZ
VLLTDALFIPHWNRAYPDQIWPTLVPGWSLNYEMFFYFLFGLSLFLGRFSIALMAAGLLGLCLLPLAVEGQSAGFHFYTSAVMLHFLAGVLLYYLIETLRKAAWQPARWTMLLLLLAGFAGLIVLPRLAGDIALLLPSSMIVFAAVFLFDGIRLPALRLLGDASYAIYLFHMPALLLTTKLIRLAGLPATSPWQVLANFAIYLTVSAMAGMLMHLLVEKPLTQHALSFIRRAPPAVSVAGR